MNPGGIGASADATDPEEGELLDDFGGIGLRFAETEHGADDDEPSRFSHVWEGVVTLWRDDHEEEIGTFSAIYVDVEGAVCEGDSVFDVFDCRQETIGYYEDLYEDGLQVNFKPAIVRAALAEGYLWSPNLLVLNRLVIAPPFRGCGRGLVALRGLIQKLRPGAGLVAMKPFPLQSEGRLTREPEEEYLRAHGLNGFTANHRKATAALRRYYARLGFAKVPRCDYMVLDPERPLRSIDELRQANLQMKRSAGLRLVDSA